MYHLIILLLAGFCPSILADNRPPNFLVIIADDIGWGDVGFTSSDMISPNIDRLVKEGVNLTNHYVTPLCNPTRTALLTGRYAHRTGYDFPSFPDSIIGLSTEELLFPELLQKKGYSTHLVGKWHLGFSLKEYTPLYRGFNTHYGYYSDQITYFTHEAQRLIRGKTNSDYTGIDFQQNGHPLNKTGEYSTFLFGNETIRLLESHAPNEPFYIQLAWNAIHVPYDAPKEYVDQCKHIKIPSRDMACACLKAMDDEMGRIMDALHRTGHYENTLVLFFSDNGGDLFYNSSSGPYRGGKGDSWEGGIKSISFLSGGYLEKAGFELPATRDTFIFVGDWFLTFLNLAKAGLDEYRNKLDSYDVWSALVEDKPSPRNELLVAYDQTGFPAGRKAYREGDWKIMINPTAAGNIQLAKQRKELKDFLRFRKALFNLKDDPHETNNLYKKYPEKFKELRAKLESYGPGLYYRTLIFDAVGSDPSKFGGFWTTWLDENNTGWAHEQPWECETVCSFSGLPLIYYMELTRSCPWRDTMGALGTSRSWRRSFKDPPYFRTPPVECGHDVLFFRSYLAHGLFAVIFSVLFSYFLSKFHFDPLLTIFQDSPENRGEPRHFHHHYLLHTRSASNGIDPSSKLMVYLYPVDSAKSD